MNARARWLGVLFGVAWAVVPAGSRADHAVWLGLGQHFYQAHSFGPVLAEDDRFVFTALAIPDPAASIPMVAASIRMPDGLERGLDNSDGGGVWQFERTYASMVDLEQAHPEGLYTFRIWRAPIVSCAIPLERNGRSYPPAPRIDNLSAAQSVPADSAFAVYWDAWEGATAADRIQLSVKKEDGDVVFETPFPTELEALDGLATSVEIPAGSLGAGQRYTGELLWLRFAGWATGECAEVVAQEAYFSVNEFSLVTQGADSPFRPSLQRSLPADGATGVPVTSVVTFHFSKPMASEVAITWSENAQGLNWAYRWDDSARTLYAIASGMLPEAATVRWTLNASAEGPAFQDRSGLRLWLTQGRFSTAPAAEPTPDVGEIILVRGEDYGQETDSPWALDHHFSLVQVELNALNAVTKASLELPTGHEVPLPLDESGMTLEVMAEYAFAQDMQRLLPAGEYRLTLDTAHDGVATFSPLVNDAGLPAAPRLLDLAMARSIESTQPFALDWAPFAEAGSDDFILVEILNDRGDTVLESGTDGLPMLPGTATSFAIPAGALNPGRDYEGVVRFLKVIESDATTYPGVELFSLGAASTRFAMRTAGEPIRPLLRVLPAPPGAFRVQVTGEPGRAYVIEAAPELVPGLPGLGFSYWFGAVAVNGGFEFTEHDVWHGTPSRFYRVRESP